jgi:hypothetical protein
MKSDEVTGYWRQLRDEELHDLYTSYPSAPELNSSAQSCLSRFFTGILIFKELTARRLYKSFGIKGLIQVTKSRKIK